MAQSKRKKKKSVNLSVGRGEKRSIKQGGGLTAKGRAKYNKATGSNLKAPVTGKVKPGSKAAARRKSFCARSRSWTGPRGKAARRRWKC
jgi:hypothetical protein|tara:strand:- start:119 stop:385 length:267 start_codon:yes stop_codon:yes gene_type:complete